MVELRIWYWNNKWVWCPEVETWYISHSPHYWETVQWYVMPMDDFFHTWQYVKAQWNIDMPEPA